MDSLVGVIEIDEMRLRFSSHCLTPCSTSASIHGLFNYIWTVKHNNLFEFSPEPASYNPLSRLLLECIIADDPLSAFYQQFNIEIEHLEGKERLIFARQCAVFLVFGLWHSITPEAFSNDVLNSKTLSSHFNVDIKSYDLEPFRFQPLPEELYQFALPPYNFKIDDMSQNICFCLLSLLMECSYT